MVGGEGLKEKSQWNGKSQIQELCLGSSNLHRAVEFAKSTGAVLSRMLNTSWTTLIEPQNKHFWLILNNSLLSGLDVI